MQKLVLKTAVLSAVLLQASCGVENSTETNLNSDVGSATEAVQEIETAPETEAETDVALPTPPSDTESTTSAPSSASVPFNDIWSEATGRGACSVSVVAGSESTFFVPSGGNENYNIIAWGNGTGTSVTRYSGMLEQLASHCIIVAAAETSMAGSGEEMRDAVMSAKEQFSTILSPELRVCTSGHSQGGGGSFNAARLLDADCVIGLQSDTYWTTQIKGDLPQKTEVVSIWGAEDNLVYRSFNSPMAEAVTSNTYIDIEARDDDHLTSIRGTGGTGGAAQRLAAVAMLSTDAQKRDRFRQALYGADSVATVSTENNQFSYVYRNDLAMAQQP